MSAVIENQIVDTLENFRTELGVNGVSDVACDLWSHALWMYRRHKLNSDRPAEDTQYLDMPMFLRKQAE